MIVLAFDIAYRTGWAHSSSSPQGVNFGHFGVSCEGEEGIGRGLSHFASKLGMLMACLPELGCLAWEKPIQASKHSAAFDEFVKGATGILRMTAFDRGLHILPCDMKSVRRHFIDAGVRQDGKSQVFMRCQTLGYEVQNTDESDAIATWDYAVGVMKVREYARSSQSFGGKGGRAFAAPRRAGGHRRL